MKTDYRILWIDDNHSSVRGDKRKFESFFRRYGIKLIPIEIVVDEGRQAIYDKDFQEAIENPELDIVLVDYNMASGQNGNDIIKYIRQTLLHYHIPIVFYSEDGPEVLQREILKINLEAQDKKNLADGIYFCHRDYIFEKVEKILTSLLAKEELPKRVRGLLMDRVSEIDAKILEVLEKCSKIEISEKTQENAKSLLINNLLRRNQNIKGTISQIQEKSFAEFIEYVTENYINFDSSRRAELLREILRELQKDYGQILSSFYNDIANKDCLSRLRNNYAHKTEDILSKCHDKDKCKYIREEARLHLENLTNISKIADLKRMASIIEVVPEVRISQEELPVDEN